MSWPTPSIVAGSLVAVVTVSYFLWRGDVSQDDSISVAFIGNSFMFVNDLPRVLENFSGRTMYQDSMLHGSLNFKSLLQKGNGMYEWWGNSTNAINEDGMRDFGACTVNQLLLGYDDQLNNFDQYYYNDGYNPCFLDEEYLYYSTMMRRPSQDNESDDYVGGLQWDFVVMNDQSMAPTSNNKKSQSAAVLESTYVPLFVETKSTPILFMTWAYWRDDIDMSGLVDVPTFTSLLWEGYQYYAQVLKKALPSNRKPRIAPVGLAFLMIWEENPSFWKNLFGEDKYHPSPRGTYLAACVIYCTIYNRLPPPSTRFTTSVFSRSRSMQISGDVQPLPSEEEAIYLRYIAKKIALQGFIPKSLSISDG